MLEIRGLPLVIRTAQLGRQFLASLPADRYQTRLAVATDHPTIAEACKAHGVPYVMTDAALPSGSDRVLQAADRLQAQEQFSADLLLNLQGDEPFLPLACLKAVTALAEEQPALDLYTAATRLTFEENRDVYQDPNSVKVVCDAAHRALYFSRASIPFPRDGEKDFQFLKHLGVYLWRREALKRFVSAPPSTLERLEKLEQLRAQEMGQRIGVAQGDWRSIDINTEADLLRAEQHLEDIEKQQENSHHGR